MSNNNLKNLLKEYEIKRLHAEQLADERTEELYSKYPRLSEINKEIANLGISVSRELLQKNDSSLVEDLKSKINILKEEKRQILKEHNLDENYLLPKYECSLCNDTGYITKNNKTEMCSCLKQKLINIQYNKSNINKLDYENFKNFDENMYSDEINEEKYHSSISPRKNILVIKKIVDNFIKNFDNPKGKNLLFTGSPGLGKTFLSNCIAKELIDSGKIVLYQTAPAMLDNIVDCKFGKNTVSKEFIDNIFESDLLIIDDLGTETMNNIKFTELFNVINTRILDNKKTIISTNLSIQNLFSIYDERIVSRIVGYYDICKFFGDDIRFKIRNIK